VRLRGVLGSTVALLLIAACAPPLRIDQRRDRVVIDVQTLGEYPTSLRSLTLFDEQRGCVAWRVIPSGSVFEAHTIELKSGENPALLQPDVRVLVPAGRTTFTLRPGGRYRVHVCSMICRSAVFTAPSAHPPSAARGTAAAPAG